MFTFVFFGYIIDIDKQKEVRKMKILKGYKTEIEIANNMKMNTGATWDLIQFCEYKLDMPSIPKMAGGVDHIDVTPNQIVIHDRGCNGRDNSVTLRR